MKANNNILRNLVYVLTAGKEKSRLYSLFFLLTHPIKIYNALIGKEIYIRHVDLVITTVCTLKCKGCGAIINRYAHPPTL